VAVGDELLRLFKEERRDSVTLLGNTPLPAGGDEVAQRV
jgi:hypothetical protein